MAQREFASHFSFLTALRSKVVVAADLTGPDIDTRGYNGGVIAVQIGNAQSVVGASYVALRLQHTDASALDAGPSDYADVTSADLIRFASQVGAMTSGIWYSIDSTAYSGTTQYVAYKGSKRYIRLIAEVKGGGLSGASVGCVLGAIAMLGLPAHWPVAAPTAVE